MDSAVKTISSLFALSAFGIAVVAGIVAENTASTILLNALISMILCRVLGFFVGHVAYRLVKFEIEEYHTANPIPIPTIAGVNESAEAPMTIPAPEQSTKSSQSTSTR